MKSFFVYIVLMLSVLGISAQTHNGANELFQKGDYELAQQAYSKLLKSYPTNALYLYRFARCAQELGDFPTALKYFDKAGDRYMLKYFYLGEIYMELWRPDEAITAYETYLASLKEPTERLDHIQKQIRFAQKLRRYLRRVERLNVIDSVEVPLDSMVLVCQLSAEAGRLTLDDSYSLVYTNQRDDRRLQAVPKDGGRVIVASHRLLEGWSAADTLPESVNFCPLQSSPYLLNDGVTIYFAANDTNGLGGLDLYVARYNMTTETYTTPENIGMPYNSLANEYMLVLDELHGVGYLATDRFSRAGRVHVYSFEINNPKTYYALNDSLPAFAKLEHFSKAEQERAIQESDHVIVQEDKTIHFVLNDSVVYSSFDEFVAPSACVKYKEWQAINLQYEREKRSLADLRVEYAMADTERQKELAPIILRLENNQSQLQYSCYELLQEVRFLEIKARQSL